MPEGWGSTPAEVRSNAWVTTEDYDELLELYRKARETAKDHEC